MIILPIHTPILRSGDDLGKVLSENAGITPGDVIVVSSKVIATVEDSRIDLKSTSPTDDGKTWATRSGLSPEFCQAVINECARMNGAILGASPHALITGLRPDGFSGRLLVPNAGLDQSNVEKGFAIGWPLDPVASAKRLQSEITKRAGFTIAVIISDSCCVPGRLGVTAFALAACGIDPIAGEVGKPDLFGKTLQVTNEAVADQMATAANMLMGNAAQSVPAAIIRDHGRPMTGFCGWVDGIEPDKDLFRSVMAG